jgi:hypothetical protein
MRPETTDSESSSLSLTESSSADSRCQHRYHNGTRCRLRVSDSQSGLCSRHFRLQTVAGLPLLSAPNDSEDLSAELLSELSEFDSGDDTLKFLARLLVLVTKGRVSPRRAAPRSSPTSPTSSWIRIAPSIKNWPTSPRKSSSISLAPSATSPRTPSAPFTSAWPPVLNASPTTPTLLTPPVPRNPHDQRQPMSHSTNDTDTMAKWQRLYHEVIASIFGRSLYCRRLARFGEELANQCARRQRAG